MLVAFFEVYKQAEYAKMQILKNYPYMQEFLNRAMYEDVSEALLAIEGKRNLLTECYEKMRAQIDFSVFEPEVEIDKLVKMLDLTIQGLMTEHFREGSFQPEMLYTEVIGYLDMMKKLTVKEQ